MLLQLRVGCLVRVRRPHQLPGALLVPSAALVRDGTAWRVFVVESQRAVARTVALRERNADVAWIASENDGVREGEQVLLYPGSTITDGQAVKLR